MKCTDNHPVLIRAARIDAGLSLRDGAELLGLTHVELGELERGVRDVPHDEWDRMFAAIERKRTERVAADKCVACGSTQFFELHPARCAKCLREVPTRERG